MRTRGIALAVCAIVAAAGATPAVARPTDSKGPSGEPRYGKTPEKRPKCVKPANAKGGEICVHWVGKGPQKSSKGQVTLTANVFKAVWESEVGGLGFRAPLPDRTGGTRGRHSKALDVYLADIGAEGTTLGFCEPSKPARGAAKGKDAMAAYCVVDNDFEDFGTAELSTEELLRATAAHEFFHAVQYAYDSRNEPRWLREGTAVWAEEQVFGELDQAHGYLDTSALSDPQLGLDSDLDLFPYGSWLFWQYLSEFEQASAVEAVWQGAAGGSKNDTLDPAASAASAVGRPLGSLLNGFAVRNYVLDYAEGAEYLEANLGSRPPLDASFRLSSDDPQTGARSLEIEGLASAYIRIENGDDVNCTVSVDATPPAGAGESLLRDSGGSFTSTTSPVTALAPGTSVILVLSNGNGGPVSVAYNATASCP